MGNNTICKLTPPEFRARKAAIVADLRERITATEELPDGFIYTMDGTDQTFEHILAFVRGERQCCEFFSFRISVPSGSSEVHLEVTGPSGTKEFIRNELGLQGTITVRDPQSMF